MKHGHTSSKHGASPTYTSWHAMKQRCFVPNEGVPSRQSAYIGRGITVCERWLDFANFLADMGERPPGKSLDRVDNDKGYEPGNCRWATKAEQCANRQTSKLLEYEGRVQTAKAWAAERGIPYTTVLGRIKAGWPTEKVLSQTKFFENQFTNPRKSSCAFSSPEPLTPSSTSSPPQTD